MQRLSRIRASISRSVRVPELKKRASNSWCAVQDTFYSTKDTFERHKVVFTVGTSIASVATAWIGYTLRHLHDTKVERRLETIEQAMKQNYHVERDEVKKIINSGTVSTAACAATAGTALVIGYGLGWRGGKWYANRKFRKEQMKLLGHIKPGRFQLRKPNLQFRFRKPDLEFFRVPLSRRGSSENAARNPESSEKDLRKTRPVPNNTDVIHNPS